MRYNGIKHTIWVCPSSQGCCCKQMRSVAKRWLVECGSHKRVYVDFVVLPQSMVAIETRKNNK